MHFADLLGLLYAPLPCELWLFHVHKPIFAGANEEAMTLEDVICTHLETAAVVPGTGSTGSRSLRVI